MWLICPAWKRRGQGMRLHFPRWRAKNRDIIEAAISGKCNNKALKLIASRRCRWNFLSWCGFTICRLDAVCNMKETLWAFMGEKDRFILFLWTAITRGGTTLWFHCGCRLICIKRSALWDAFPRASGEIVCDLWDWEIEFPLINFLTARPNFSESKIFSNRWWKWIEHFRFLPEMF